MKKDIYKTDKGHEINVVINQVGDTEPVRTTTNTEMLEIALDIQKSSILKARKGSLRERLAEGKIIAFENRIKELS